MHAGKQWTSILKVLSGEANNCQLWFFYPVKIWFEIGDKMKTISDKQKNDRVHCQQICTRKVLSSSNQRKTIPDGNLDLHKAKSARNNNCIGRCKRYFSDFYRSWSDNSLFKAKITTVHLGFRVYMGVKSRTVKAQSTGGVCGGLSWKEPYTVCGVEWYYLEVDSDKLKVDIVTSRTARKN